MSQEDVKTLSLACPSCGGKMQLSADEEKATCPYCGHEMLIDKDEPAQEEYERRMADARADEDIKDLKSKRQRKRRLKGWLIAICVIVAICLVNVLIPGSPMHDLAFPRTADPFAGVNVKFSGMSGEGKAELQVPNGDAAEYAYETKFEVTPSAGLKNGDTVTLTAAFDQAAAKAAGITLSGTEKTVAVEGLAAAPAATKP